MKSSVVEKPSQKSPKFSWIGGLKEFRDQYTPLEFQEKASDWIAEFALRKLDKKQKEHAEVLR